jgi:hypothetical protein
MKQEAGLDGFWRRKRKMTFQFDPKSESCVVPDDLKDWIVSKGSST